MIDLGEREDGLVLPVRAQPGAKRNGIVGEQAGALKVAVSAPAQDGRANAALIEVLREALQLKRSQIELIAGPTGRDKRYLVRDLTKRELEARLAALQGPG